MNEREICEKIIEQGNCEGISCSRDQCPFESKNYDCRTYKIVKNAKQWLEDHPEENKQDFQNIKTEEIIIPICKYCEYTEEHGDGFECSAQGYKKTKKCWNSEECKILYQMQLKYDTVIKEV